ncbi:MAG: PAS domain S-box protein, partial [Pseudomonadota bacterium]
MLFLTSVAAVAWFSLSQIEHGVREDAGNALRTIVRTTHESLEIWIADRKDYVRRLAENSELRHLARLQLALPRTRDALLNAASTSDLRAFFERNRDHYGHTGFFIIAPDYVNVASMRDTNIGATNLIATQRIRSLKRTFDGDTVLVPPVRSDVPLPTGDGELAVEAATMFIAAPIRSHAGEVMGVLTIRLAPDDDFSRITQLGRIGETGETYAFDENGMMLTQSRFTESLRRVGIIAANQSGILGIRLSDPGGNLYEGYQPSAPQQQREFTYMARHAIAGGTGANTAGYRDYRGVRVLGAWMWDTILGIGIATEIDEADALQSFRETRATIVGVLVVTVLLTMLLLYSLTRAMRHANVALRSARDDLELRVEQRTGEIKAAHRLLDDIFRSTPDGVLSVRGDGAIVQANPQAEKLFGYTCEELVAMNIDQLVPKRFRQKHSTLREKFFANPSMRAMAEPRDVMALNKSGQEIPVEISLGYTTRGDEIHVVATVRDISSRREAAEALRESEERFRAIFEDAGIGVALLDVDGRIMVANNALQNMFGYRADELAGEVLEDLAYTEDNENNAQTFREFIAGGRKHYKMEKRYYRKSGDLIWANLTVSATKDENGRVSSVVGMIENITERKRAEQDLEEQLRFESLLSSLSAAFVNLPAQRGDNEIEHCLRTLNELLNIDRATVLERTDEGEQLRVTHSVARSGYELHVDSIRKDDMPIATGTLMRGETFKFSNIDDLAGWAEREREFFQATGARACLCIPLMVGGNVIGVAAFSTTRGERAWSDGVVKQLRLVGEVFANALQRKRADEALRESESRTRLLLDSIDEGVFGVNLAGECTFVNPAALRLLGYQDASELVGQHIHEKIHHTRRDGSPCPDTECRVYRAFREDTNFHADDEVLWRANGTSFDAEYRSNPVWSRGTKSGAVVTFVDISQRKRAEAELMQAATVFENTDEGIIVTDARRRIVAVNKAFTNISGYQRNDVLGKSPSLQNSKRHDDAFFKALWESLEQTGQWRGEIWNRRKSGEVYPAWENITVIRNANGEVTNYVSVFSDISVIKESEQRLSYLAHHDALTGLPNRLLFTANLDQALERSRRHDHKVALLFLDLDRFKMINDTLGHETGDQLLQEVAKRLRACVRGEDTVARLGGDEFTVILSQVHHAEDAALLAEKILERINKPLRIRGREILTTTSIGISVSPGDANNCEDLIKAADAAMYHAKGKGRNTFQFYTTELTDRAMEHLAVEHDLRIALQDDQLVLYYQPQVDLRTDRIVGVEALLRWQHPQRGLLLPDTFIHVAEESGLIDPLSEWVLRRACQDASIWRTHANPGPKLAINISGRQIFSESSLRLLEKVLTEVTFPPCALQLDLEITEHELQHAEPGIGILTRLRKLGVMLAVDDFGTGYSSLSRLRQLPIDSLKIDRSFISDVPGNSDDEAIVTTIIAMGQSLKLQVVAEGVENAAQLEFLRTHGCDEVQGFLLSEPLRP